LPPTATPPPTATVNPAWLQDRTIFYTIAEYEGSPSEWVEIWRINADGSGKQRLFRQETGTGGIKERLYATSFELSPDGQTLAYAVAEFFSNNDRPALWLISADGTQSRRALHFPDLLLRSIYRVRWSPDGRHLVFSLFPPNRYLEDKVCVLSVAEGTWECIGEARQAAWLPDGQRISYLRGGWQEEEKEYRYDFCLLDLEHQPWQPTCFPVESSGIGSGYDWSPDGKWIAYNRKDDGVYVRSATTGESRRLVKDKEVVGGLVDWSPDGRMIAYWTESTHPQFPYTLWVVDVQDGRTLVKVEGMIGYWSSDNKVLAGTGGKDQPIYLVFVPGGQVWKVPGTEGFDLIAW
jgi:Tol biopolymer transport system component